MSRRFKLSILSLILCMVATALSSSADQVPATLQQLAAKASLRPTWPTLRSYAKGQKNPEWRGWAYFVVGYSEFTAQSFTDAAQDLGLAAKTAFSFVDFAVYYQAAAASRAGNHLQASEILKNFSTRFPQSCLHGKALELDASALLAAQKPQDVIVILSTVPEVHARMALDLLLGQSYQQVNRNLDAVHIFQEIYYTFPATPQSKPAGDALKTLREQLGESYPIPSDEAQTGRAEILFKNARYKDALAEFEDLGKAQPSSPYDARWQLGQARCLVRLHRAADALELLFNHFTTPDLEAQRLSLLAQIHIQQSDAAALTLDLAQLETQYSTWPAYATALSAAGGFYYRQFNWQEAARNYQRQAELFPHGDNARDDGWRLGWCYYLLHDPKAADAIRDYLIQFPDSPRAAAALYWLARTQEEQGTEARALYELLRKRFVHSYYALQAAARLATLTAPPGSGDNPPGALTTEIAAALGSPSMPGPITCLSSAHSSVARPALILHALAELDLEDQYLKGAIGEGAAPTELRLLLARADAARNNESAALFDALKAAPAYSQLDFSDLPEEVWQFLYPLPYSKIIEQEAAINDLDPHLIMGLIRQESAFDPHALSSANARGLMQLLPETAAHSNRSARVRAATRRLYDPAYNIRVGSAYLAILLKEFNGHPEMALAAYNAGDNRVREWLGKATFPEPIIFLESIPFVATRIYVEMVLRDAEFYRQLMSDSPHFAECKP